MEALSSQHSAVSENQQQKQQQNQNRGAETPELLRAEELVQKLGETYDELIRLMDQNGAVARHVTGTTANHEEADRRLKARLELADATPRCRWIKQGGTTCGSPQMKNHIYCFAHIQMAEAQALALRLPPPEDANAIQVGLMRIQKALIEDTITTRKAGLLLYSMQLALTNVGQTTFGQAKDEELVLETVDEEEALSEHQTPLTTKDTKDAKEETALPGMHADHRGVQQRIKQIEWKPSPDMYRMDTREGREAYEASLRVKIEPRPCAEERPPQPGIAPHPAQERRGPGMVPDDRETHYSSLRDERLNSLRSPMPKGMGLGPRSASEPLDADTGARSVLLTEPYAVLG
jgi:hypothetical protein